MMKIKHFLRLIILFLSVIFPLYSASAALNEVGARQWAEDKGAEILKILAEPNSEDKYAALDKILTTDIDLDHAARFVVGKYWRTMTEEQQTQYVGLFKRYVTALYKNYPLDIATDSVEFKIEKVLPQKDKMLVKCLLLLKALQTNSDETPKYIKVLFVLKENSNRIQVEDLKVEDSSLLLSFRNRFYKMIHQDNDDEISWFLEDFNAIIEDTEASEK
jgi:phospholipid transport system substrate-binding protein